MSRHAVVAERERAIARAARVLDQGRRALQRRANFIQAQRLSLPEASALPRDFDRGPEYDLNLQKGTP